MATLLPADLDLTTLEHSERRVVQAFLDGLDDQWFVVPTVRLTDKGEDREVDVVLVSGVHGAICVETKGGKISIRGGDWYQYDHRIKSPVEQVMKAKHCLVRRCRACKVDIDSITIHHAVALPDEPGVPVGGLGLDAPEEIVFAAAQLREPARAVERLCHERAPIAPAALAEFLRSLRPDIELDGTEGRALVAARARLDDETRVHLATLAGLDSNRRVLVQGGAGTGKTMLAVRWARRAVERGERTLVVSFNIPVGGLLRQQLAPLAAEGHATVGHFHEVARVLMEPFGFRIGEHTTQEYWRDHFTDALAFHAASVGTPFDTVIVDEGQDFHPHWIAALERLLDPAGARRLLMVADARQDIYVHGWQAPADMVQMPLTYNLRNCASVARVVQHLGGPAPLPSAPRGDSVVHLPAGGHKEVRKRVRDAVARVRDEFGVPCSQIAVLTTSSDVRDRLLAEQPDGVALAQWEHRGEDTVLCETVRRAKGLEHTAVVLVDLSGDPARQLLYIGASRAVASLRLVGTEALALAAGVRPG